MRAAVTHLLTTDTTLINLVPANRWYVRSAVPDSPTLPFAVLSFGSVINRGPSRTRLFSVWVYQERGSYKMINEALRRVEELLANTVSYPYNGEVLAVSRFESRSDDLFDDQWRANTIHSDFTLVGRPL